jgi:hypothetical protein
MNKIKPSYKWATPYHWLFDKIHEVDYPGLLGITTQLACIIDHEDIEDLFQTEMENDNYYTPLKSS